MNIVKLLIPLLLAAKPPPKETFPIYLTDNGISGREENEARAKLDAQYDCTQNILVQCVSRGGIRIIVRYNIGTVVEDNDDDVPMYTGHAECDASCYDTNEDD